MNIMSAFFWDKMLCTPVEVRRRFGGTYDFLQARMVKPSEKSARNRRFDSNPEV
jgi:hypothetical protein